MEPETEKTKELAKKIARIVRRAKQFIEVGHFNYAMECMMELEELTQKQLESP